MVEQRYKVGRELAKRFGLRDETFRAGLAAAKCVLEKPGKRGTLIAESELQKFIKWARARAERPAS